MLKHLKLALFCLILVLPLFISGIYFNSNNVYTMSRGNYFFSKSKDAPFIQKIVLTFNNQNTITFEQNGNYWAIKEVDDYYASPSKMKTLTDLIKSTIIYRADKDGDDKINKDIFENAVQITTFDKDNNVIDKALIAPKTASNLYYYAKLNDKPLIYQLIGNLSFSRHIADWTNSPILAIDQKQIKMIKTNSFSVYKRSIYDEYKSVADNKSVLGVNLLTDVFWYLNALDIKHTTHFNSQDYMHLRHFTITLFNGLIYNLDVFRKEDNYWLNISLDKAVLTGTDAFWYVEQNSLLYDGWFFKLNKTKGHLLATFEI